MLPLLWEVTMKKNITYKKIRDKVSSFLANLRYNFLRHIYRSLRLSAVLIRDYSLEKKINLSTVSRTISSDGDGYQEDRYLPDMDTEEVSIRQQKTEVCLSS